MRAEDQVFCSFITNAAIVCDDDIQIGLEPIHPPRQGANFVQDARSPAIIIIIRAGPLFFKISNAECLRAIASTM